MRAQFTIAATTFLAAIVLTGCGAPLSNTQPTTTRSNPDTTTIQMGMPIGSNAPCDPLPASEASQLLGTHTTSALANPIVCRYLDSSQSQVMELLVQSFQSDQAPKEVMANLTKNGTYEPVEGIGDVAVYAPGNQIGGYALYFIKSGNQHLTLVQISIATNLPGVSRDMAENVAKAIAPKIS